MTTTLEAPIQQHGFVVRDADANPAWRHGDMVVDDWRREQITDGRRSGLAFTYSTSSRLAPPALSNTTSPGLPSAGEVRPAEYSHLTKGVKCLMKSVKRGLKAHQDPEAATEGFGGTYFFADETGKRVAIMKPCDEEPLAPNNPKGFVGRAIGDPGLKPTVRVGEAAAREVAAYLLDKGHFAGVPHTVMVEMAHPVFHYSNGNAGDELKVGSLQEFIPHNCDTSEMGASRFSASDVQRIGILDIRLYNTDRHAGNILVRKRPGHGGAASECTLQAAFCGDVYELVPIDHGFALPEALEPPYFEWQHWPQAMLPFGKEELAYIASLDASADVAMLKAELPMMRDESLRLLQVTTALLKKCAAAGLSLSEIAGVVSRPIIGLDEEPSQLEKICFEARLELEDEVATDLDDLVEEEEEEEEEEEKGGSIMLEKNDYDSPTASSESRSSSEAATAFDTGRLEDSMFSMDEDGNRTPVTGSPPLRNGPIVGLSRFSEVTPGSALDSLPTSFAESMSLREDYSPDIKLGEASIDSALEFAGPATFVSGGCLPGRGKIGTGRRTSGKIRRRRGARRSKGAQMYPPLVESRNYAAGANQAIFSNLTDDAWSLLLHLICEQIDIALRAGIWKQTSPSKQAPMMSCPKF